MNTTQLSVALGHLSTLTMNGGIKETSLTVWIGNICWPIPVLVREDKQAIVGGAEKTEEQEFIDTCGQNSFAGCAQTVETVLGHRHFLFEPSLAAWDGVSPGYNTK